MTLDTVNSHPRDSNIEFFPQQHKYKITRDGRSEFAPVSVTSFCKPYFTQFDAKRTVERYFDSWRSNPNSKYFAVIKAAAQAGSTEAEIKASIMAKWAETGARASEEGTYMHARAEAFCNGEPACDDDREMQMLKEWAYEFQPEMLWRPYRTEWALWWDEPRLDGAVLVAGTLDLLMRSEITGEFALVDFKRCDPTSKCAGGPLNLLGPCGDPRYHRGYAKAPLGELEDDKFGAYTMQLNVLSKILRERYGVDVGQSMYLLQIHPALQKAHCVRVPRHREATDTVFAIEAERARVG